jgi:hypothetical protein
VGEPEPVLKVIRVERIKSTYRASLTSEEKSLVVLCSDSEQLISALGNWEVSPIAVFDILNQLESSRNAELHLQED